MLRRAEPSAIGRCREVHWLVDVQETRQDPPPPVDIDEQTQLQIAMSLSQEEAKKSIDLTDGNPLPRRSIPSTQPAPRPPAGDMDDDTQLQIALNLSKEVHQQRQKQGAYANLCRELDIGDMSAFTNCTRLSPVLFHHLEDLKSATFGSFYAGVDSTVPGRKDSARVEAPWLAPPVSSSPAPPWERSQSPADHWDSPRNASNLNTPGQAWTSPAHTAERTADPALAKAPSPRAWSPSDGDLFDEAMDGGQMNMNGRGGGSPELFDLSHLEESLAAPSPRNCRTPEAFLGPTAASLVNLDALIPANSPAKAMNPFLSGVSSPSPNNPFQAEQPKLTLNQMGSSSNSPVPFASSLPYSASLPLPASHQAASLPTSLTHPSQAGALDIAGALPQPLLPLLSASVLGSQSEQHSQNPFL
ncbi:unnamed protein product [Boreogadus saida]